MDGHAREDLTAIYCALGFTLLLLGSYVEFGLQVQNVVHSGFFDFIESSYLESNALLSREPDAIVARFLLLVIVRHTLSWSTILRQSRLAKESGAFDTKRSLTRAKNGGLDQNSKMGPAIPSQGWQKPKMLLSPAQRDLVNRLKTNPDTGLTTDEVTARREDLGVFNVVKPPIDCPPTVCCLLPCIKHMPSMKAFKALQPEEAEVLRNGTWIRYDVTSLVVGDIIRMEEGDIVPADCVVLDLTITATSSRGPQELLVDVRGVTAEEKPRSAKRIPRKGPGIDDPTVFVTQPVQLFWGGTVVQGGCIAVVSAGDNFWS